MARLDSNQTQFTHAIINCRSQAIRPPCG